MKRRREADNAASDSNRSMEIVWQTPANPPEKHDYIFRDGNLNLLKLSILPNFQFSVNYTLKFSLNKY